MKRINLAVNGILLALALLCAGQAAKAEQEETEGGMFGAFETWTLSGEEKDQSLFADGELNMINIWATYCGPCIQEMPELGELAGEYEDQGLQIIGIISDVVEKDSDAAEAARLIVEETKADYTHLMLSEDLYYGYLMEVQAVPTTVFVDGEGNQVGETYVGSRDKEEWSQIIDELLEEVGSREAESEETESEGMNSEETKFEEAESEEMNSEKAGFEGAKSEKTESAGTDPEEANSGKAESKETTSEETESKEVKSEKMESAGTKLEEARFEENGFTGTESQKAEPEAVMG